MLRFLNTIVLLVVTAAVSKAASTAQIQSETQGYFLGTVEGKSYLADNTTYRSWNDAKEYCTSFGMQLATVTSIAQKNFLDGIHHLQFQDWYWTAGKDAQTHQQFTWYPENTPLSESLILFSRYQDMQTFVAYDSRSHVKKFFSLLCTSLNGVLCGST